VGEKGVPGIQLDPRDGTARWLPLGENARPDRVSRTVSYRGGGRGLPGCPLGV